MKSLGRLDHLSFKKKKKKKKEHQSKHKFFLMRVFFFFKLRLLTRLSAA